MILKISSKFDLSCFISMVEREGRGGGGQTPALQKGDVHMKSWFLLNDTNFPMGSKVFQPSFLLRFYRGELHEAIVSHQINWTIRPRILFLFF
jgi:hypothetical protein